MEYILDESGSLSQAIADSKPHGFDISLLALPVEDLKGQFLRLTPKKHPIRKCYVKFTFERDSYYLLWENGKIMEDILVPDQEQRILLYLAVKGKKIESKTNSANQYTICTNKPIFYPFGYPKSGEATISLLAENFRRNIRLEFNTDSFETINLTLFSKAS